MASVRKRILGNGVEVWICDYFDQAGKRGIPEQKVGRGLETHLAIVCGNSVRTYFDCLLHPNAH